MLAQENFRALRARVLPIVGSLLLFLPSVARSAGPDPILSGPAPGPCAGQAAAADYSAGVDAAGGTVVPAEGDAASPDMGDGTVLLTVPRSHGRDVQVPVHLADLSPPPCGAHPPVAPRRSPR